MYWQQQQFRLIHSRMIMIISVWTISKNPIIYKLLFI